MRGQRLHPQTPKKGAGYADDANAGQTAVKQDKAARFLIAKLHLYPLVPISDVAKRHLSDPVVRVSSLDVCGLTPNAIELRPVGQQIGYGPCERHNGPRRSAPPPAYTHSLQRVVGWRQGSADSGTVGQTEGV